MTPRPQVAGDDGRCSGHDYDRVALSQATRVIGALVADLPALPATRIRARPWEASREDDLRSDQAS